MTTKDFILATDKRVLYNLIYKNYLCMSIECNDCKCLTNNICNIRFNLGFEPIGTENVNWEFKKQHLQNIKDHYPELLI